MNTIKIWVFALAFLSCCLGVSAQVNSGSNGSDGAFNPTADTVIDMHDHPDGIYQYTSVNIPGHVSISFTQNANNTPVVWLVQGDVNVAYSANIDVSGHGSYNSIGATGGPGGWAGGTGGGLASAGQGPGGGGAAPGNPGAQTGAGGSYGSLGGSGGGSPQTGVIPAGPVYGNSFLLPLLGGSGGGGGNWAGGGGGGAILIAASGTIRLDGAINAKGGFGHFEFGSGGGGGSGGAVRFVCSTFTGIGSIEVNGGTGSATGGDGRVRIDAFQNTFGGGISAVNFTQGYQPIIIPAPGQGVQLNIASIGGIAVSQTPTGAALTPDAIISGQQANPITIVVNCANLPLNTPVTVTVKPASGSPVSVIGNNTAGTPVSSTATVSLNMPRGGGIVYATAVVSN